MTCEPITDPACRRAPERLRVRASRVSLSFANTIVVPVDPKPFAQSPYYSGAGELSEQNEVTFLIDGPKAFAAIHDAIASTATSDHFVYLLGWWFSLDAPLLGAGATIGQLPTMRVLLINKGGRRRSVEIRAMFWGWVGTYIPIQWVAAQMVGGTGPNLEAVDFIEALPNGAAVLDNRTMQDAAISSYGPLALGALGALLTSVAGLGTLGGAAGAFIGSDINVGSHHQKIVIVYNGRELTAFAGGVDINEDRIDANPPDQQPGSPLHDVHLKIVGPAAWDLMNVFMDRWTDHPEGLAGPTLPGKTRTLRGASLPRGAGNGHQSVEVGVTFANGGTHTIVDPHPRSGQSGPNGYRFAPLGRQSARKMFLRAVERAERFIYVEDQFLYGLEAADALAAALPRIQHLTLLIPHWSLSQVPETNYYRTEFINRLFSVPGALRKVRVFNLRPTSTPPPASYTSAPHTYVHSKTVIIDDRFALVGSFNVGRRSWTTDSEVYLGVYDTDRADALCVAHRLRMALWAEHLGMDQHPEDYAELIDGVASAVHWVSPPPGALIEPYDETQNIVGLQARDLGVSTMIGDFVWDHAIEPDGS